MSTTEAKYTDALEATARITSAWLAANPLQAADLPGLILDVHRALVGHGLPSSPAAKLAPAPLAANGHAPAIDPRRSLFHNRIVCIECGASFTSIRRHLMQSHALEPADYRKKWNLSRDYPMVSPDYAKVRSKMARESGLGHHPKTRAKPRR